MDFITDDSDKLPELPPMGHPLQKLGARLAELLDDDHWAECERLLLEGWAHDAEDIAGPYGRVMQQEKTMELETVNKLYLELSQFATAETKNDLELEKITERINFLEASPCPDRLGSAE